MKKKASKRSPRRAAWSDVPNVDFGDYQVKKNRFAKRMKKERVLLVHDAPSSASLKAIPEADFGRVKVRRSNYADRIAASGMTLQVGRGRPRGGQEAGPTVLKSVRLPPAIWKELTTRARTEGTTVHALLRRAILQFLGVIP
jgi:hypothetical protein